MKYEISDYLRKKHFASFLPGIAGLHGIPLWSFYVNRGQCICSFGMNHKDNSIMEFFPANKSFERVSRFGFRTFIKIYQPHKKEHSAVELYEPFTLSEHSEQNLSIEPNLICIEDINKKFKIRTEVKYYILPNENFGAMVRDVSIQNLSPNDLSLEIIDGMPEILPAGIETSIIKIMSYTARAWADVESLEEGTPFYKARSSFADTESVSEIKEGVFFINLQNNVINKNIIIDRDLVFDYVDDLSYPLGFSKKSVGALLKSIQFKENKYSSAFAAFDSCVSSKSNISFQSYFGLARSIQDLEVISTCIKNYPTNFSQSKIEEAREITSQLGDEIKTSSSLPLFDAYCQQNYIDNILRGGYPLVYKMGKKEQESMTKDSKSLMKVQGFRKLVYHVYSRKHGDLERDYNFFQLEARHYSIGNGNFRDVCQNRRNDVYFNPEIEEFNVLYFINFLQADGYNPLVIKGVSLKVSSQYFESIERNLGISLDDSFKKLLDNFTLGSLLEYVFNHDILSQMMSRISVEIFLKPFIENSHTKYQAVFGEGFWTDHFTYILDLIETYLDIYPERNMKLLYETQCSYFDSPASVAPRKEKYFLKKDSHGKERVVQLSAVSHSKEKETLQKERGHELLLDENGDIYFGTVFEKLFCLVTNKVSSLDSAYIGIEMEANKPGWNDALNGLPGLLGSGVSETIETLRIVDFLLQNTTQEVEINKKIYLFANKLSENIKNVTDHVSRWNSASDLREQYRSEIVEFMSSKKMLVSVHEYVDILKSYKSILELAVENARNFKRSNDSDNKTQDAIIPVSFIENIAKEFSKDEDGHIRVSQFSARALPLFLEAPAKSLYTLSKVQAKKLYNDIKHSELYDKKLQMYKTSCSLENESSEIGRARAFTPGWLERESIFMHMEFKYLLALLKKGLYQEFYTDFFTCIPCFLDADVYGRSILEASSFIVSSVNKNTSLHGRGYSARLSGSTAELLSMWKIIFFGHKLFSYNNNELQCMIAPCLSSKFFEHSELVQTRLFSKIEVNIINKKKIHTYDTTPSYTQVDDFKINDNIIRGSLAERIRNREVKNITICYE